MNNFFYFLRVFNNEIKKLFNNLNNFLKYFKIKFELDLN